MRRGRLSSPLRSMCSAGDPSSVDELDDLRTKIRDARARNPDRQHALPGQRALTCDARVMVWHIVAHGTGSRGRFFAGMCGMFCALRATMVKRCLIAICAIWLLGVVGCSTSSAPPADDTRSDGSTTLDGASSTSPSNEASTSNDDSTTSSIPDAASDVLDAGIPDAASDVLDAGIPDAASDVLDAGIPDAASDVLDAGIPDAASDVLDAGIPDVASDVSDAGILDATLDVADTGNLDGGLAMATVDAVRDDPDSAATQAALPGSVAANNAFALDLYAHLITQQADAGASNVLTSPFGASLALTMTYAGAVGPTATEMATALRYGAAASSMFDGQNALSAAIASRGPAAASAAKARAADASASDYELTVVNAIWGEETYTWQTPFLDILAQSYGSGVYLQDFINRFDQARLNINAWVSSETADKINNLLPPLSVDSKTRMVLVNATHLKFPWVQPFVAYDTRTSTFTKADGTTVSTSFMNQVMTAAYVDDGQAQIVGLPLSGHQVSVVIALPHPGVNLADYEASLTTGSAALTQPKSEEYISLHLPKAAFTSPTFSLKPALQAMGMNQAFDANVANFSGMCANPPDGEHLFVSDVLQKATIDMQESGVEAAAATAVIMGADAAAGDGAAPVPTPMEVDRPYLLSIVDVPTGAILFLGHIEDPTDVGSP